MPKVHNPIAEAVICRALPVVFFYENLQQKNKALKRAQPYKQYKNLPIIEEILVQQIVSAKHSFREKMNLSNNQWQENKRI